MEELAGTWGWRVSSGAHEAGEAWGDAVHKATTPIKLGLTFLGGGAAHSRRQGENQQRAARRGRYQIREIVEIVATLGIQYTRT
jgi:hypothetical protein